jgi:uncharacterized protein (UPF0335 family)
MAIRRIEEQTSPIHEEGYPANAPEHSPYGLSPEAKLKLKTIASNIIYCDEKAKEVADERKTFYAEAKAAGFDATALRQAMAFLKDEAGRTEQEQLRDLYVEALREKT